MLQDHLSGRNAGGYVNDQEDYDRLRWASSLHGHAIVMCFSIDYPDSLGSILDTGMVNARPSLRMSLPASCTGGRPHDASGPPQRHLSGWNAGGHVNEQEDYDRLRPPSSLHGHVILMCFSIDSPGSLDSILDKGCTSQLRRRAGPRPTSSTLIRVPRVLREGKEWRTRGVRDCNESRCAS
ncbi:hypothetical protein HPB48_011449 [Haemaphysalis longicornis]|uniref:Uncharacterized protein n=1 Tax=Haemaphysalis longicornis TaxID=44386 RepID=A0A9J6FB08_HAELO|nr:hypothetical protein HPB48_011449 [Haemaphysalis longicornis]